MDVVPNRNLKQVTPLSKDLLEELIVSYPVMNYPPYMGSES